MPFLRLSMQSAVPLWSVTAGCEAPVQEAIRWLMTCWDLERGKELSKGRKVEESGLCMGWEGIGMSTPLWCGLFFCTCAFASSKQIWLVVYIVLSVQASGLQQPKQIV